jgi:hypothetical protein
MFWLIILIYLFFIKKTIIQDGNWVGAFVFEYSKEMKYFIKYKFFRAYYENHLNGPIIWEEVPDRIIMLPDNMSKS